MQLKLIVERGKPEGQEIPIRAPKFLIGRGSECHLRPNSEMISRLHTAILVDDEEVRLKDLGSTNGTIVNGQRVEGEVVLYSDDIIQVGPLAFRIVISEAVEQPVPEPVGAESKKPEGMLGSQVADEGQIGRWLMAETDSSVPESPSEVYSGDTQMISSLETQADEQLADRSATEQDGQGEGDAVREESAGPTSETEEAPTQVQEVADSEFQVEEAEAAAVPDPATMQQAPAQQYSMAGMPQMPYGQMPMYPSQMPQGQMPQGQMPQGQMPQGQMPQGQMPQGQMPYGPMPMYPGQMPYGSMPQGQMPQGQMPYGPQQMPMPQGQMPYGNMPPQQMPMQPQQVPPEPEGPVLPDMDEEQTAEGHKVLGRRRVSEKKEIKETREDTSNAAADILRRMMERRR